MENKYLVSIVLGIYNKQDYLDETMASLRNQTIGFDNIQIILVDDGSSDNTPSICDNYAKTYPNNIIALHKSHEGLSSARNYGLKYATGKYLNFMDADDKFSDDALKEMVNFLDNNDTKIVTVPITYSGDWGGPHDQNGKFKNGARIIDLEEEPTHILQFVSSSLFDGSLKDKIVFDSSLYYGADIKVIYSLLRDNPRFGVLKEVSYEHRVIFDNYYGLEKNKFTNKNWYLEYFDNLFFWLNDYYLKTYENTPAFLHVMFAEELKYRFKEKGYENSNKLVDTKVLTESEHKIYLNNLKQALNLTDDFALNNLNSLIFEAKLAVFKMKYGNLNYYIHLFNGPVIATPNNLISYKLNDCLTELDFLRVEEGNIIIEGRQAMPSDIPWNVNIVLKMNDRIYSGQWQGFEREFIILDNTYRVKKSFVFKLPINDFIDNNSIRFYLTYDANKRYGSKSFRLNKHFPIGKQFKNSYYVINDLMFTLKGKSILAKKVTKENVSNKEKALLKELWRSDYDGARKAYFIRKLLPLFKHFKRKPLWIVSDRIVAAGDNGEAFFEYMVKEHKDDINTVFVISKSCDDYKRMKKVGRTVDERSHLHKLLWLLCDYNISSQASHLTDNPFVGHDEPYRDLRQHHRFVFLQHGVLYGDISGVWNRINKNFHGFVTSTKAEYESVLNPSYACNEKQVWLTGLPRFDKLYRNEQRQITIIPTWRSYLMMSPDNLLVRNLIPGFKDSEYYIFYKGLLNNKKLIDCAKRNNVKLAFWSHPTLRPHMNVFVSEDSYVQVIPENTPYKDIYAESNLMLTDYSSAISDFIYLGKPIVYTHFDKDTFYSGAHICKKGFFDYDIHGLGEIEYTLESTVNRLIEYIESDFKLKDIYKKRIDEFYVYRDKNNCERVYNKIIELEHNDK